MRGDQSVGQFGEHRVGVDVALAGQRVLVARSAVRQQGIRRGQCLLIAPVQGRIVGFQLGDKLPAFGRIRGGGDLRGGQREELAFLQLHSLPRRIADHAIEPGFLAVEHVGEPLAPIETGRVDRRVVNQRVAVDDVLRELGEQLARTGRANPEGQLRDLDRLGREIDAVEVLPQDERRNLFGEFLRVRFAQLVEVADDFVVARFQHVVGLEQKRAAAAGRIDDLEVPQDGEASTPVFGVVGGHAPAALPFRKLQTRRPRPRSARRSALRPCTARSGWSVPAACSRCQAACAWPIAASRRIGSPFRRRRTSPTP